VYFAPPSAKYVSYSDFQRNASVVAGPNLAFAGAPKVVAAKSFQMTCDLMACWIKCP
jgi:hypothetical protein